MTADERAALEAAGFRITYEPPPDDGTPSGYLECTAVLHDGYAVTVGVGVEYGSCDISVGTRDDSRCMCCGLPAIKTPAQAIALVKALRGEL